MFREQSRYVTADQAEDRRTGRVPFVQERDDGPEGQFEPVHPGIEDVVQVRGLDTLDDLEIAAGLQSPVEQGVGYAHSECLCAGGIAQVKNRQNLFQQVSQMTTSGWSGCASSAARQSSMTSAVRLISTSTRDS